jgi:hypothetical protein
MVKTKGSGNRLLLFHMNLFLLLSFKEKGCTFGNGFWFGGPFTYQKAHVKILCAINKSLIFSIQFSCVMYK